jgi:hypothetical protein
MIIMKKVTQPKKEKIPPCTGASGSWHKMVKTEFNDYKCEHCGFIQIWTEILNMEAKNVE